jgi:hypothetical protein
MKNFKILILIFINLLSCELKKNFAIPADILTNNNSSPEQLAQASVKYLGNEITKNISKCFPDVELADMQQNNSVNFSVQS